MVLHYPLDTLGEAQQTHESGPDTLVVSYATALHCKWHA